MFLIWRVEILGDNMCYHIFSLKWIEPSQGYHESFFWITRLMSKTGVRNRFCMRCSNSSRWGLSGRLSIKKFLLEKMLYSWLVMSVKGTGERHSWSASCGPFLILVEPGIELPEQLLLFSLGIRALGNLGLAAAIFFLDVVAGGVNNAVLNSKEHAEWDSDLSHEVASCHVCTGKQVRAITRGRVVQNSFPDERKAGAGP